jgi:DNA-binding XRE family transcriptional regulator
MMQYLDFCGIIYISIIAEGEKKMESSFGGFLRKKRIEKNLTQKELSKLLFVSESAVSKWEKDVSHPDITLLPNLSEIRFLYPIPQD